MTSWGTLQKKFRRSRSSSGSERGIWATWTQEKGVERVVLVGYSHIHLQKALL